MRSGCQFILLASILSIPGIALSQDDVDLIDDLPKATKEAAAKGERRTRKPRLPARGGDAAADSPPEDILPKIPGKSPPPPAERTTLIDDTALRREGERAAASAASPIPEKLADALAIALHNSPEILVAEAKVREAQVELNQQRQSVVHHLTIAYGHLAQRKTAIPADKMWEVELLRREDEAKILYLMGVGATAVDGSDANDGGRSFNRPTAMRPMGPGGMSPMGPGAGAMMGPMGAGAMGPMGSGTGMGPMMRGGKREQSPKEDAVDGATDLDPQLSKLPEKMRRFLSARVDVEFEKQPLKDVLEYLKEAGKAEVNFVILDPVEWEPPAEEEMDEEGNQRLYRPVTLHLKQITIAAALQALVDLFECGFAFRDYGILVLGPSQASGPAGGGSVADSYRAAGVPMIAPPPQVPIGGILGGMGAGMGGMGMGGMPGMGGPAGMSAGPSKPAGSEK